MLTILFDGVAYGMLLFVLACGLAVTLGLMNFINLAHGAFAMAGGYTAVLLVNRCGVPFLLLPAARLPRDRRCSGALLERTLYRPCLWQVAPRPGAVLDRPGVHGGGGGRLFRRVRSSNSSSLPEWLQPRFEVLGRRASARYRLFIIVICGVLALALQMVLARTRFGSRLRAAVDDPRVARGLGINVDAIFAVTFAVGSGLAGLGGALGAEILGLDPIFPLKFMVYFLIVVTVGGTAQHHRAVAGRDPARHRRRRRANITSRALGAFVIYTVMIVVLLWRPQGLFARGGR